MLKVVSKLSAGLSSARVLPTAKDGKDVPENVDQVLPMFTYVHPMYLF